jgi:hypothetical protein
MPTMSAHRADLPSNQWSSLTVTVCPATVIEPDRSLPVVLGGTVTDIVPLPVPLVGRTRIHESLATAVHAQPVVVETLNVFTPPFLPKSTLFGVLYEHDGGGGGGGGGGALAAACDTVNVLPAIVSVPVRAVPVLAAAVKPTVPLPVPLVPDVTVSHDALLVALHRHADWVETATGDPAPPAAAMFWLVGAIEYVHVGVVEAAACVMIDR